MYTWGWKECVPTGRVIADHPSAGTSSEKDERHNVGDQGEHTNPILCQLSIEGVSFFISIVYRCNKGNSIAVSPRSQVSRTSAGTVSAFENRGGEESTKRRRISSAKVGPESSTSSEETLSSPPCLVTLSSGVRIVTVAAGGRHTLALSGNFHLMLCCIKICIHSWGLSHCSY